MLTTLVIIFFIIRMLYIRSVRESTDRMYNSFMFHPVFRSSYYWYLAIVGALVESLLLYAVFYYIFNK